MTGKAGIWRNALLLLFSTAAACAFPAYLFFILYNGTWQAVFSVWLVLASFGTLWMFPALWGYFYDRTQALIGAGDVSYGKFLVLGLKAPFFNPFSYILVIFLHSIALFCFALGC